MRISSQQLHQVPESLHLMTVYLHNHLEITVNLPVMHRHNERTSMTASGAHAGHLARRSVAGGATVLSGGHAANRSAHLAAASSADASTESAEALRCSVGRCTDMLAVRHDV